jgi:hypothetical protein
MAATPRTYRVVKGTSEPQDVTILNNGSAIDGTGYTVGFELYDQTGTLTTVQPTAAWLVQASGTVRLTGWATLSAGQYRGRFTLTDGSDQLGYVPNGVEADRWLVVEPFA